MSNVRKALILKASLVDAVNRIVQSEYGSEYSATANQQIRVKDANHPFEQTVGTWHIKDNTLYVEVRE
jgi:ribosome-associated toxin RatA of RatAB toxin-antitoxin module